MKKQILMTAKELKDLLLDYKTEGELYFYGVRIDRSFSKKVLLKLVYWLVYQGIFQEGAKSLTKQERHKDNWTLIK